MAQQRPSPPLVPPEVDLKGLEFMPLDVTRLRDSDLASVSTGDEFRAAVLLWCASWHQRPAASVPDDDRVLAMLAGYGRDMSGWMEVRDVALRGWALCADGRLYHPVVAEKAIEAWGGRVEYREKVSSSAERKRREREERKQLFADLKKAGITPGWKATTAELRALATEHLGSPVTTRHAPVTVTGHENECDHVTPRHAPVTRTVTAKTGTGTGTGTEEESSTRHPSTAAANPQHATLAPERAGPPGQVTAEEVGGSTDRPPPDQPDRRTAEARRLIAAFDDALAAVWGEDLRRPFPTGTDMGVALAWVDAGATAGGIRPVIEDANRRVLAGGHAPPRALKARDSDVRAALTRPTAATAGGGQTGDGLPPTGPDLGSRLRTWAIRTGDLDPAIRSRIRAEAQVGRGQVDATRALMAELGIRERDLDRPAAPDALRARPAGHREDVWGSSSGERKEPTGNG